MSPEALARLREMVAGAFDGSSVAEQMLSNGPVAELLTDLRALLDAYDTTRAQVDAARETAGYMDDGWRITDAMNAAFAKAGRR